MSLNMNGLSFVVVLVMVALSSSDVVDAAVPMKTMKLIQRINKEGPYLGVVVTNNYEMNPLLQSPAFVANKTLPYLDFSGRRFRFGKLLETQNVILVMTGLGMLNAGLATELLVTLFKVEGVLHYGIARNADPNLQIGDVVIPRYWAHTTLWNWQRYGDGPNDELSLESNGDYTRKFGYLKFSDFNNDTKKGNNHSIGNLLNNVWYQPEEIFPIDGTPEVRQHAFWVPVDKHYYAVAKKLEGMKLKGCMTSTLCLPRTPRVIRVERGSSANIFIDNAAYRKFMKSKFNVTAMEMESAAIALVCLQKRVPFIIFRALSDFAGGGSAESNEAGVFAPLAAQNSVNVLLRFMGVIATSSDSQPGVQMFESSLPIPAVTVM